jgi:Tfp pilus assembly protein PilE
MIELLAVVVVIGVVASITAGRFHELILQEHLQRAATVVQNDLEGAFAIATRNRRPIEIAWNSSSLQMNVTDRASSTNYRTVPLGQDPYNLTAGSVSFSRSPLEVYPNGMADDTLTITLTSNSQTKRIHMTRTGLVSIQ